MESWEFTFRRGDNLRLSSANCLPYLSKAEAEVRRSKKGLGSRTGELNRPVLSLLSSQDMSLSPLN